MIRCKHVPGTRYDTEGYAVTKNVAVLVGSSACADTTRCSESSRGTEPRPQHNAEEYSKPFRGLRLCVGQAVPTAAAAAAAAFANSRPLLQIHRSLWETKTQFLRVRYTQKQRIRAERICPSGDPRSQHLI